MLEHQCEIRVRYQETDAMGVVYHGNYFIWFEIARISMLDALGMPYRQLEAEGYLLPVLEIHAKFQKPCYFDDRVQVTCRIIEPPRLKIRIEYEVNKGGILCSTGCSQHVFTTPQGKAIKPPELFMDSLRRQMNGYSS